MSQGGILNSSASQRSFAEPPIRKLRFKPLPPDPRRAPLTLRSLLAYDRVLTTTWTSPNPTMRQIDHDFVNMSLDVANTMRN